MPLLLSRKFLASPLPGAGGYACTQNAARPCPSLRQPSAISKNLQGPGTWPGHPPFKFPLSARLRGYPALGEGQHRANAESRRVSVPCRWAGGGTFTYQSLQDPLPEAGGWDCGGGLLEREFKAGLNRGWGFLQSRTAGRVYRRGEFTGGKSRVPGERESARKRARERAQASERASKRETVCACLSCVGGSCKSKSLHWSPARAPSVS